MKRRCLIITVVLMLMGSFTVSANAESIELGTGDWCPFGCNPETEDGKKGYLADIMISIFNKKGYTVNTHFLTFSRNLKLGRSGELDMIIGLYREDAPDFIFPDTHQGLAVDTFYIKKTVNWQFTDICSLKKAGVIGLITDYAYGGGDQNFKSFVNSNPNQISIISGSKPLVRSITMLLKDRINAFIEVKQVAQYNMKKMAVVDQIKEAGHLEKQIPVYIALSPALPPEKALL